MKASILAVVGALGLSAAASADVLTIDNFTNAFPAEAFITGVSGSVITQIDAWGGLEVGWQYLPVGPGNDEVGETAPVPIMRSSEGATQFGLSGVLGGQRAGLLEEIGTPGAGSSLYIDEGFFGHSNDAGNARSRVTLSYGNINNLNLNLLPYGAGAFQLNDWSLDQGTVLLELTLQSGSTTQTINRLLAPADFETPVDYSIGFSEFNAIDFADVDVITFRFTNQAASQDSSLFGGLFIVPTPGAGALLGLGGVLLARRRR